LIVGIDARGINKFPRGIGLFTYSLLSRLVSIPGPERYIVFTDSRSSLLNELAQEQNRIKIKIMEFPSRDVTLRPIWDQLYLLSELYRYRVEVFWGPFMVFPLIGNIPSIITIHDLTFIEYPFHYPRNQGNYWRRWVPKSIIKSDIVIANSWATKSSVERYFPEARGKVEVVYPAVKDIFESASVIPSDIRGIIENRFNIKEKYLLSVGGLEALHKNIMGALKTFALLKERYHIEHKYVIVDRVGPRSRWILDKARNLGIGDSLVLPGTVSDDDLILLYQGADLLLMPSLNEGFGFPLLEAMACGTPVAASNRGSIPEVLSDCGLLFEPNSYVEMSEKILLLIRDEKLRQELKDKGYQRYKIFSWKSAAEKILKLIRIVGSGYRNNLLHIKRN
jgi:glycosyltransferase involved in cell wall biosynthesis